MAPRAGGVPPQKNPSPKMASEANIIHEGPGGREKSRGRREGAERGVKERGDHILGVPVNTRLF